MVKEMKIKTAILFYIMVSGLGVLFHYCYNWLNMDILKIVFPKNESVFEHIKLLIFPTIIMALIDMIFYKTEGIEGYILGLLIAIVFMVASHYTVVGITGRELMPFDIGIYFISMFIIMYYRYKKITLGSMTMSVILFVLILVFVEYFTFYPLEIPFFLSPQL